MANVYEAFQRALVQVVRNMREEICELEDPPTYFDFNVTVDGRTLDGDLEIKFVFNSGSYSNTTKGGNLRSAFEEYMRRYGWTKKNDPLCLPRVEKLEKLEDHSDNN